MVYSKIRSAPIAMGAIDSVKVVFANHRELGIEGDSNGGVPRKLESCSVVKSAHD